MKTTQDNSDRIFRDKINSLDSLPEDYTPSLDSKWELLMASMQQPAEAKIVAIEEKKEKKRFFYLYAAAACFLCVFTFGWLFLRDDTNTGNQIAVATEKPSGTSAATPEKTVAAAIPNQAGNEDSELVATQEISAPATAKKAAAASKNQQILIASAKQKTTHQKANGSAEATQENITQTEQLTSAQPEQLLVAAASATPSKTKAAGKKKARSVELDFEPEQVITPSQHDQQVAQQNLKFKFLPANNSSNVAQHQSVLKLKHTF